MLHTGRSASAALVLPTGLAPPAIAAQHGRDLPLRHGTYDRDTAACAEAPLADMHDDGGGGIGGPHYRPCHARVVSRDGGALRIDHARLDAGAGPATRMDERLTLRIEGPERHAMHTGGETFTHRWSELLPAGRT